MTTAQKFIATRTALGISVKEMALACGVHRQTLVKWERGEAVPSHATVRFYELLLWLHEYRGETLAKWLAARLKPINLRIKS